MAQSSRYFRIDDDVLLEFIYHDQGNPSLYEIEVDDNGSEIKKLTVNPNNPYAEHINHLICELGSDVVNFDVTVAGAYLSIENFAGRTLLLEAGKTYKFNLSNLPDPSLFVIDSDFGTYSLSVANIGTFIPTRYGTINYSYQDLTGGKIVIADKANPLFSTPDEDTGNDINHLIGRFHAIPHVDDSVKYALLGYDVTGLYDQPLNYINSYPGWNGSNEADLLTSQTYATAGINKIKYDSIRLHLRAGFSFAARGYEGFLFEVKTERDNGIKNYLTQLVYLNQSNYEVSNPKPFLLGETLFTKFVNLKVPTLVNQNYEFEDFFYGNGEIGAQTSNGTSNLSATSNYEISFKLIDRLENIDDYNYFYVAETNTFSISREDEYADFTVVVEEAEDGDYFKIYGEKDNNAAAFEAYIVNRINTSSDDIVVAYEVEVYEQVGISQIKTYDTTFTQVVDFDTPIWFRPVIVNGNVAVNFSIDVVMRIINETDGNQIVKRASLTFDRAAKYAKRMQSVRINSATKLTEVYNTLPNLSANRAVKGLINNSLPKSTRYVPAFIETTNIVVANVPVSVVSNDNSNLPPTEIEDLEAPNYKSSGEATIYIPPFTTYYKFYIAKQEGDDLYQVSLTGADDIVLSFEDNGSKKIFNYQRSKDIDLGKGEILFKVDEANASAIRGMQNKQFYISSKSGSDNTVIAHGKFTIN